MVQGGLSVANDVQYRVSRSLTVIMQSYTLLKLQKTAVDVSEQFFNISYCSSLALWFLLLSMLKNCHISSDDELCSAIVRAFWNDTNTNLILVLWDDGWCKFMYSFTYLFIYSDNLFYSHMKCVSSGVHLYFCFSPKEQRLLTAYSTYARMMWIYLLEE